jgi:hypothetical protein
MHVTWIEKAIPFLQMNKHKRAHLLVMFATQELGGKKSLAIGASEPSAKAAYLF